MIAIMLTLLYTKECQGLAKNQQKVWKRIRAGSPSEGINTANTLTSGFQSPELANFCLSYLYFIMASLANYSV